MYGDVLSPAKIRRWPEDRERMDGPVWKLALKWMIFLPFWKAGIVGQRLASEPRPPILPLAATLMCPWPCAARPYLASLVFLNSWVSERGMTSGTQTFGCWSKSINQNQTPELCKFPSEEESVFTAIGTKGGSVFVRPVPELSTGESTEWEILSSGLLSLVLPPSLFRRDAQASIMIKPGCCKG